MTINSSGQIVFSFPHIEGITLGVSGMGADRIAEVVHRVSEREAGILFISFWHSDYGVMTQKA